MALFGKKDKDPTEKKRRPIMQEMNQTMVRPLNQSPAEIIAARERLKYMQNLRTIINRIHAAPNLDSILIDLKNDILSLLDAERITIYAVAEKSDAIYSKFKDGDDIQEIRVTMNNTSIAGYVANNKKELVIEDAYNTRELQEIDAQLSFNRDFDLISGFRTRQVLAVPIVLDDVLHGVIQLLNKKHGPRFLDEDRKAVLGIAQNLAVAFSNFRRAQSQQLSRYGLLVIENILSNKNIEEAFRKARENDTTVEQVLMEEYSVSKQDIVRSLEKFYRMPFFEFKQGLQLPPVETLDSLDPNYLRNNLWVPVKINDGRAYIAIDNPKALVKIDDIRRQVPARSHRLMVAFPEDILKTIDYFWGAQQEEQEDDTDPAFHDILEDVEEDDIVDEIEDIREVSESDNVIIRLVDRIIRDAHHQGASDIHIEPSPQKNDKLLIRFRVDGVCREYQRLPNTVKRALGSRIKVMAGLDIANRLIPQDGKIQAKKFGGPDIELRVATIPTIGDNESVVLRLLASSEPIPLAQIGMRERNFEEFKRMVELPYGIVLVVGPTGSGKTTTLHSGLGYINTPQRKIWTAEDPVEITQKGLNQVQINPKAGYTFARAMRAFLRGDPDVIMIGEMRDMETASMAIEASLTGHLVFSTLHTNSAPETIVRLLDIGIDPFNFADALIGVLAQRLVRKVCSKCCEETALSEKLFDEIAEEYGGVEALYKQGVKYSPQKTISIAKGCLNCNNGYRGRMGIHELLTGSDHMKTLIQKKVVAEEIREAAIAEGMTTLKQDGILKVLDGHTDLLQVRAVCIK